MLMLARALCACLQLCEDGVVAGMGGVLFCAPLPMAPSALFCSTLHWVVCHEHVSNTLETH